MSQVKIIETAEAPAAIGPYSQAVVAGDLVYTAGQIPLDPATGDIRAQTRQVLQNLEAILAAAGATPAMVVKTTLFVRDLEEFAAINEVYGDFFGDHRPARSTVQVARLPRDCGVEIECIARLE